VNNRTGFSIPVLEHTVYFIVEKQRHIQEAR